jgi:hypothetical protein
MKALKDNINEHVSGKLPGDKKNGESIFSVLLCSD